MPRFGGLACGGRPRTAEESSEMPNLSIRSDRAGLTLTLSFTGELDGLTAERFQSSIEEAKESDAAMIVLDLTEVRFVDSSGLVALLMAARRSDREGTGLRVRAGSGYVRQLLELTSLDKKLDLVD
jgi:anti-sigma B factor antagonist